MVVLFFLFILLQQLLNKIDRTKKRTAGVSL